MTDDPTRVSTPPIIQEPDRGRDRSNGEFLPPLNSDVKLPAEQMARIHAAALANANPDTVKTPKPMAMMLHAAELVLALIAPFNSSKNVATKDTASSGLRVATEVIDLLVQIDATARDGQPPSPASDLARTIDQVSFALLGFYTRIAIGDIRPSVSATREISASLIARIRAVLQLPSTVPTNAPHPDRGRHTTEAQVINETMDIAIAEADDTFTALVRQPRQAASILAGNASRLNHHLDLLAALAPRAKDAVRLPKLEILSTGVLKTRTWIAAHPANAQLLVVHQPSLAKIDVIRFARGLGSVMELTSPPMPQAVVEDIALQQANIAAAEKHLRTLLASYNGAYTAGLERFKTFGALQTPPEDTPLWLDIVASALTIVLANMTGPFVGGMVAHAAGHHARLAVDEVLAKGYSQLEGSVIDQFESTVPTVLSQAATQATTAVAQENSLKRTLTFFSEGLAGAQNQLSASIENKVTQAVHDGTITAEQVEAMESGLRGDVANITNKVYLEATHGFIYSIAQQGLQHSKQETNKPIKMKNYYGTDNKDMYYHGAGNMGKEGVARIEVTVHEEGGKAHLSIDWFRIQNMNDDAAHAIAERAGMKVGALGLPLEIHARSPVVHQPAAMAVDEKGNIGDLLGWGSMVPPSKAPTRGAESNSSPDLDAPDVDATNSSLYTEPKRFWAELRNMHIPSRAMAKL